MTSKSQMIRDLLATGQFNRSQIAHMTGAHYQMVRNVENLTFHTDLDSFINCDPVTSDVEDFTVSYSQCRGARLWEDTPIWNRR